jgi:polyhydroxyalkanoate synthesis regulator phasin
MVSVRLSDHLPSKTNEKEIDIYITQCLETDMFILFVEDKLIPLLKNRTECKEFIRVYYEYKKINALWSNYDDEIDKLKNCRDSSIVISRIALKFPIYTSTKQSLRKQISDMITDGTINAIELYRILKDISQKRIINRKNYNKILERDIEELLKNKNEMKTENEYNRKKTI